MTRRSRAWSTWIPAELRGGAGSVSWARAVARSLYEQVADLPIISPHGHVPPAWLAQDTPFRDPTSLLITPDHYVTRIMHASGVHRPDHAR